MAQEANGEQLITGTRENVRNTDDGHVCDTVIEMHSQVNHKEKQDEIVLNVDRLRIDDSLGKLAQGTSSCSGDLDGERTYESEKSVGIGPKNEELGASNGLEMVPSNKNVSTIANSSCMIDIKDGDGDGGVVEDLGGERVCRICHLSSEQSFATEVAYTSTRSAANSELVQLGCGCKDELGIAHIVCAEAWFRIKGNRLCEICGETAKNISGIWDDGFMEKLWNERLSTGSNFSTSERGGCWRGQPLCNFLMACLVIAFVLPWFFRVKMF